MFLLLLLDCIYSISTRSACRNGKKKKNNIVRNAERCAMLARRLCLFGPHVRGYFFNSLIGARANDSMPASF